MNDHAPIRVIKVGGSLLHWMDCIEELPRWLTSQPAMTNLLIAGGGVLADEVRDLDRKMQLSAETAHRMAVEAMAINSHLLRALLPEGRWLELSRHEGRFGSLHDGRLWIIEPVDFMDHVEAMAEGQSLPIGWHVTSDSIAARLAEVVNAEELVLLKSALPETTGICSRGDAATAGFVDRYFPEAAARLVHIRAVNLRDALFAECPLA